LANRIRTVWCDETIRVGVRNLPEEDVPLKTITLKYGVLIMVALTLLRLSIGWHFYKEGRKKFTPDFSGKSFLLISEGPLEGLYQGMISDPFGQVRLNRNQTVGIWNDYLERASSHYDFDQEQVAAAKKKLAARGGQLDWYLDANAEEIDEYRRELERLEKAKADTTLRDVAHRQDWIESNQRELRGKVQPWLNDLAALGDDFQKDIHSLAAPEKPAGGGPSMYDPGSMWGINTMVKWTVVLVGVFLILGLFTRFWSLVGIGFLCAVISSQWPGWPGAEPTYYQVVELCALLVLLASNAGRFAGLDFFVDVFVSGYRAKVTQGTNNGSEA
jgi:uncharacterized membrane protein YphA (DoxX/SURF4 family)